MEKNIEELKRIIEESNNIVFFGGAGVSTESDIPDFRSVDGLYNQKYDYPPEMIISHSFFNNNRGEFFRFYKEKMLFPGAIPNKAHIKLAELEKKGKLKGIITQNIDGLHQKAGSEKVWELHGSVHRNHCTKCGKFFGIEFIVSSDGIPLCDECKGVIKPDVVLYEEMLDDKTVNESIDLISKAEILIVGGTSLVVYPAAGLIDYYRGNKLILINKSSTPKDSKANLVITGKIGEIMGMI